MGIDRVCRNLRAGPKVLRKVPGGLRVARAAVIAAVAGCVLLTFSCATKSGSLQITKGPALLAVSEDRAAVMWETNVAGSGTLSYGTGLVRLNEHVESKPQPVDYGSGLGKQTVFVHKVWLEGLKPGQVYKYRVTGPNLQSELWRFTTTPTKTDRVRFIVYGDSRTAPENHRKLVELMKKKNVDFVVHAGDLVTNGDKYEQWGPQFFAPLKGLAESVPIYAVKGNHDKGKDYFEKLLIPEGRKKNFGFDYGPVHFFLADNSDKDTPAEETLDEIVADAAMSRAGWKFVTYHIPSLNAGGHWSAWGYPDALPGFAQVGVDFVVTGHSHQYERFRPIAPPEGTDGSYVTYITTGGGGAKLHDVQKCQYHARAVSTYHFCLFEIEGGKLTLETIDINGATIDQVEVRRTGGQLNKEYLATAVPMAEIVKYQKANLDKEH